jgi:hypothetical protein
MLKYMNNIAESAAPIALKTVSRRTFLQASAVAGGFTLAAYASPASAFVKYPTGGDGMPRGISYDVMAFVAIDPDRTVPRWAQARAHLCRWLSPRKWRPIGTA